MLGDQLDRDAADPDSLAAMLCVALDGAAADPVRLHLLTALFLMTNDTGRQDDIAKMRQDGPTPVYKLS